MRIKVILSLILFLLFSTSFAFGSANKGVGGIESAPPMWTEFTNVVLNPSFENGTGTDADNWTEYTNLTRSATYAHSGSYSMKGTGEFTSVRQNNVQSNALGYKFKLWVYPDTGATGSIAVGLYNATRSGSGGNTYINATSLNVGEWNQITITLTEGHFSTPEMVSDLREIRIQRSSTTGDWYFDDVQIIPLKALIRNFIKYPNFQGYVWDDKSQIIQGVINANAPDGQVLTDYKAVITIYKVVPGDSDTLESTQTISTFDGNNEGTYSFDITSYDNDTEFLIKSELQDKATSTQQAVFSDWRVVKKAASHRATLRSYIDENNVWVVGGTKKFMWGVFDRWYYYIGGDDLFTTKAGYLGDLTGMDGVNTFQNYQDSKFDMVLRWRNFAGANPGFNTSTSDPDNPATRDNALDQIDPWIDCLNDYNVGYSYFSHNLHPAKGPPYWAGSLTNIQMNRVAATFPEETTYYAAYLFDEPDMNTGQEKNVSDIYDEYNEYRNQNLINWGVLYRPGAITRYREVTDVMSTDPYPLRATVDAVSHAAGDYTAPSYAEVKYYTETLVNAVYNSRPVWPTLQLFRPHADIQWWPTDAIQRMMFWKAVIAGARGVWWWTWGEGTTPGLREIYFKDLVENVYSDFKQFSADVKAIEDVLVAENVADKVTCNNGNIDFIVRQSGGAYYVIASNSKETSQSNVTFTFDGSITGTIPVYTESRSLTPSGADWVDNFDSYATHVYIVNGSVYPTVTTTTPTNVQQTTATSGGNVIDEGNSSVTVRGACWSTSINPTTTDSKTEDGSGSGAFVSSLTGLSSDTVYFVRAYATNGEGTSYGNNIQFATLPTGPVVATLSTQSILDKKVTNAISGGNITNNGGAEVTARGVCWSESSNPTIADSKTSDGTGSGIFYSSITELLANTTYHVRAYATNEAGTAYGNDIEFKTYPARTVNIEGSQTITIGEGSHTISW